VKLGGVFVFLFYALSGTSASAQAPLSESEVARLARDQSPAVRVADAEALRAAADISAAGLWPNPSIELERSQALGSLDDSEDTVSISIPLISGRQAVRRSIARVNSSRADLTRDQSRATMVAAAVRLFYQALTAERGIAVVGAAQGQLEDARRVLESREAAGEASGYASARLALEVELARSQLAQAEVDAEVMRARLATHLGLPNPQTVEGTFDVEAPLPLERLQELASERRAEMVAVARLQQTAERARSAASWAWFPELSVRAGYQSIREDTDSQGYVAALELGLPLFNRGQGAVAQANAALRSANERSDAVAIRVAGDIIEARVRLVGLLAERARFAQAGNEHVELLRRAAQTGFEGGERTLVELLDARQAAVSVARRSLALDLAVRLADVDLRRASGELQ